MVARQFQLGLRDEGSDVAELKVFVAQEPLGACHPGQCRSPSPSVADFQGPTIGTGISTLLFVPKPATVTHVRDVLFAGFYIWVSPLG